MINITTGGIGISSANPRGLIKMIVDIITIIPTPSAVKRVLACSLGNPRQKNAINPTAMADPPNMVRNAAAGFTASSARSPINLFIYQYWNCIKDDSDQDQNGADDG